MRFDVVTAVPECFAGWLDSSIIQRARAAGKIEIALHALRNFAPDKHRMIDDYPYGGGRGMVLKPEPIFRAVEYCLTQARPGLKPEIILLTPQGQVFTQSVAQELATCPHLIFICGRYEGVDERVREHLVTWELSIGDYVLIGGEIPAMVVMEAVARLVPGVVGTYASTEDESFSNGLLEYPHYTRPAEFRGWKVPDILLSGHHERVRLWRHLQRLKRTLERRPELLTQRRLTREERRLLVRIL
ncbi:MAG TPA: tRNA (guanosine(37)-N1)-methyltransferase TrmD [Armatimonadetes bacterium]|nr:tRNA (guanosine(37)-N1)-methyltransferase TrmD [Armatimonadota bacterium]